MTNYLYSTFSGELPLLAKSKLPKENAAIARNCKFRSGSIEPVRQAVVTTPSMLGTTETMWRYNKEANAGEGFWFQFDADVDVVAAPLADDQYGRAFFTGLDKPRYVVDVFATSGGGPYPTASFSLGISAPANTITVVGASGSPPEGGQALQVNYIVTYVNGVGNEGPPCSPSNAVDRWDGGGDTTINNIPVPAGDEYIQYKRIYRTETGGYYNLCGQIPAAQTSFVDTVESALLGEPIPSVDWDKPNPTMIGLTALPNGILAGFFGNTLCFSEPWQPHAWPVGYRLALDYNIVGLVVTRVGLIVCTKGKPYLIAGTHPSSFSQDVIESNQACVSKRGIVDMGDYGLYPSPDGLIAAGGKDAPLITEKMISKEQWQALKPETIHAYHHDGRYIGFYDDGVTQGSFSFHPQEGFVFFNQYAECGYEDIDTDTLYIKQGTSLMKWQDPSANYETITLRTKTEILKPNSPVMCAKVDADSYPVTFRLYANDILIDTVSVSSRKAFRVARTNDNYRELSCEVSGNTTIHAIQMASSMGELI
jgi:hypothetical protein